VEKKEKKEKETLSEEQNFSKADPLQIPQS